MWLYFLKNEIQMSFGVFIHTFLVKRAQAKTEKKMFTSKKKKMFCIFKYIFEHKLFMPKQHE